jgi:hypothetical protein
VLEGVDVRLDLRCDVQVGDSRPQRGFDQGGGGDRERPCAVDHRRSAGDRRVKRRRIIECSRSYLRMGVDGADGSQLGGIAAGEDWDPFALA